MTDSPFPSRAVRRLAADLSKLRAQVALVAAGQGVATAGLSSIDGRPLVVKDSTGTVRQVHGAQADGTYTTKDVNGPTPPAPAPPLVYAVPGGLKVTVTAEFADGSPRPADVQLFEVHVDLDPAFTVSDATLDAALVGKGSVTFATDDYVPHTIRLVAKNTSGRRSAPSGSITVTPAQLGPGDIAPGGVGTINLDDGAVTPPKSGTGVTSNLVPDPGFNDAGWRAKRTAPPWGFVDAASVGFTGADWAAFCGPTTVRAVLSATGTGGVPVTPGESYFVAYDIARSASGAGQAWLEVRFYRSDGTEIVAVESLDPMLSEVRAVSSLPTGVFDTRTGQVTVPVGAATMRIGMVRQDEVGTSTGNLYLDRLELRSVITRSTTGQRVETSPSGVLVFDAANNPVGSINLDGSLSMTSGQFNTGLTYKGTEVGDLLDQRARGQIARVDAGSTQTPATTSEIVWLEFDADLTAGRAYKLSSAGLVARGTGSQGIRVRYTTNGTRPLVSSSILAFVSAGQGQTVRLSSDLGALATVDRNLRMVVTVVSFDGASAFLDPADPALGFSAWVEDTGARAVASGGVVNVGGGGTTTPTRKTYTTRYDCTWSRCWSDTGYRGVSPLYQGRYDGVNGQNYSAFGFNYTTISADLSGATITKVELFLYAEHWYYNAGGEVWLGTTSLKAPPGNNAYPADAVRDRVHWHLNKPEGRWVTLPVAIGNEFKSGATGAFVLDARHPNNNLNDYGRMSGQGSGVAPALRITYDKPVT